MPKSRFFSFGEVAIIRLDTSPKGKVSSAPYRGFRSVNRAFFLKPRLSWGERQT